MSEVSPRVAIPVSLANPGQFFACCGLLELAHQRWPEVEGQFDRGHFLIFGPIECSLPKLLDILMQLSVANTMTSLQTARLEELTSMPKKQRDTAPEIEEEKKSLEALRRESPIVLSAGVTLRIDWFCDEQSGGSRFKTWAGQQSVLEITRAMHAALSRAIDASGTLLWGAARGAGLPFNFDSDLGGQGSALDIGFSFDPLSATKATRIEGMCRPALELLSFIGLQRFRPREIRRQNRFVYTAWSTPLPPAVAAVVACDAVQWGGSAKYEFKLLYRTKYLKSFLPAIPYQGDHDE